MFAIGTYEWKIGLLLSSINDAIVIFIKLDFDTWQTLAKVTTAPASWKTILEAELLKNT